jgi:hypothetical protein
MSDQNMVGVDLDRTLAVFKEEDWEQYSPEKIGKPILEMVDRVNAHIEKGDEIVILTARVHPSKGEQEASLARKAIQEWCLNVFGEIFEVTCMKHPKMHTIYDDRAVTVEPNTGRILTIGFVEPCRSSADSLGAFLGDM